MRRCGICVCCRELGFVFEPTSEQLERVNAHRSGKNHGDSEAAKEVNGDDGKTVSKDSPFRSGWQLELQSNVVAF